jgi:hypothetical protein
MMVPGDLFPTGLLGTIVVKEEYGQMISFFCFFFWHPLRFDKSQVLEYTIYGTAYNQRRLPWN